MPLFGTAPCTMHAPCSASAAPPAPLPTPHLSHSPSIRGTYRLVHLYHGVPTLVYGLTRVPDARAPTYLLSLPCHAHHPHQREATRGSTTPHPADAHLWAGLPAHTHVVTFTLLPHTRVYPGSAATRTGRSFYPPPRHGPHSFALWRRAGTRQTMVCHHPIFPPLPRTRAPSARRHCAQHSLTPHLRGPLPPLPTPPFWACNLPLPRSSAGRACHSTAAPPPPHLPPHHALFSSRHRFTPPPLPATPHAAAVTRQLVCLGRRAPGCPLLDHPSVWVQLFCLHHHSGWTSHTPTYSPALPLRFTGFTIPLYPASCFYTKTLTTPTPSPYPPFHTLVGLKLVKKEKKKNTFAAPALLPSRSFCHCRRCGFPHWFGATPPTSLRCTDNPFHHTVLRCCCR